mmetsp:Transcript_28317/g.56979  ORF Transcript_28317/g.56979 Transcript_28317/m.56979 type:complete len:471 (+) Transcript_28317:311-1723(+)
MSEALGGIDIGRVMSSDGPIVKCVLLRTQAGNPSEDDVNEMSIREMKQELESFGVDTSQFVEKPDLRNALTEARLNSKKPASSDGKDGGNDEYTFRGESVPLLRYMEEIEVDTTPKKSMVAQVLGGDFTFLGQYEDEGIMVMVRRPDWEDEESSFDESDIPPVNPHPLQPPFDEVEVRGDILLIRVAETAEELDADGDDDGDEKNDNDEEKNDNDEEEESKEQGEIVSDLKPAAAEEKEEHEEKLVSVPANDEFFLDYSKEEYLKFASRTDVEGPPILEESEESSEEENEEEAGTAKADGDEDEDYDPEVEELSDEEYDDEEHQVGMMNLILGQILRKFHEENGRGPDTLELLEMRKALADRLGVEVPPVDEEACDWDKKAPTPKKPTPKKVVVAEERNECETFPREASNLFPSENDEEAVDDQDESSGLKRPVEMIYGEQDEEDDDDIQHQSKKASLCKESGKEGEVAA